MLSFLLKFGFSLVVFQGVPELRLAILLEDPKGQKAGYNDKIDLPATLPPGLAFDVLAGFRGLLRPVIFVGQLFEDFIGNFYHVIIGLTNQSGSHYVRCVALALFFVGSLIYGGHCGNNTNRSELLTTCVQLKVVRVARLELSLEFKGHSALIVIRPIELYTALSESPTEGIPVLLAIQRVRRIFPHPQIRGPLVLQ